MVFVTTDLIGIPRTLAANVARRAEEKYHLPRKSLLFNASHTHCGPELRPERDYFYGMAEEQAEQISAYTEKLETALVELIGAALDDLATGDGDLREIDGPVREESPVSDGRGFRQPPIRRRPHRPRRAGPAGVCGRWGAAGNFVRLCLP